MQVTGIVEDSMAAKVKATEALMRKNQETLTGLRLMEGGRIALVAGVWGALGLRRRILVSFQYLFWWCYCQYLIQYSYISPTRILVFLKSFDEKRQRRRSLISYSLAFLL